MTSFYKQRVVLQKLIYTDPNCAGWLQRQRVAQNAADTLQEPSTTGPSPDASIPRHCVPYQ